MKIARIFFDVDMRCSFEGIRKYLKSEKVDVQTLASDYVIFLMNRKMTCFKVLVDNSYLVYFKNNGRRIPLDAIQYLPTHFGGSEMEYNRAVQRSLVEKLAHKQIAGKAKIIRRRPTETHAHA